MHSEAKNCQRHITIMYIPDSQDTRDSHLDEGSEFKSNVELPLVCPHYLFVNVYIPCIQKEKKNKG